MILPVVGRFPVISQILAIFRKKGESRLFFQPKQAFYIICGQSPLLTGGEIDMMPLANVEDGTLFARIPHKGFLHEMMAVGATQGRPTPETDAHQQPADEEKRADAGGKGDQ